MKNTDEILDWCETETKAITIKIDELLDVYQIHKNNNDFNALLTSYTQIRDQIAEVEQKAQDLI